MTSSIWKCLKNCQDNLIGERKKSTTANIRNRTIRNSSHKFHQTISFGDFEIIRNGFENNI